MSIDDSSAQADNQQIPSPDSAGSDKPDPQFEAFRRKRAARGQRVASGIQADGQAPTFSREADLVTRDPLSSDIVRDIADSHSKAGSGGDKSEPKRPVNLLSKAIAILSRQECSEAQLRKKLTKYTDDTQQIDQVIERLQHENWQSDERFAQAFLNSHEQRWGNAKILNALSDHKLDEEVVQDLKEQLKDSEYDRALAVWTKKFQHKPCKDLKDKAKQLRFMASRGFSADVSYRIVNEHCDF